VKFNLLRAVLVFMLVAIVVTPFAHGAFVSKGADGMTWLTLNEDEVEQLGNRLRGMAEEIDRLKAERKTQCNLM
jgi:uncharacterized ferredoxin-like protein